MKKLFPITLVLLCGVLLFYSFFQEDEVLMETDLLPEGTSVFIRQDNLKTLLANFTSSQLGTTLAGIDHNKIAMDLEFSDADRDSIDSFIRSYKEISENPLFLELFGNHFSLALLPVVEIQNESNVINSIKDTFLIISEPAHSVTILESLTKVIPGNGNKKITKFNGYKITSYKLDEANTLYASVVNNFVLLSLSKNVIERTLLFKESDRPTLTGNSKFTQFQEQFTNHSQFLFLQFASLQQTILTLIETYFPEEQELLQKEIDAFNSYTFGTQGVKINDKGSIETTTRLGLDPEMIDPLLQEILLTPAVKNEMLDKIPEDLLVYYWLNTVKLKEMFNYAVTDKQIDAAQLPAIKKEVKKITGIELEELLTLFDSQFTLMMKESEVQMFLPVPDISFYVKINNVTGFNTMLSKILKENKIVTHQKEYKEHAITSWGEFAQNSLQPAYTTYDDFLVVASNEKFIKDVLDHMTEVTPLSARAELAPLINGFYEPNNGLSIMQVENTITILKNAVSWAGTLIAIQDREAARRSKIVIDQLVHPLLDGLTMYKTMGYRAYLKDNTINIETITLAEGEQ